MQRQPASDRRILRSRDLMFRALADLVLEKNYDQITVQDILDRADVGRSTFYAHFRGKDDLLLSPRTCLQAILDQEFNSAGPERKTSPILRAASALFMIADTEKYRVRCRTLIGTAAADAILHTICDMVNAGMDSHLRSEMGITDKVRREAAGAYFSSCLVGLIAWWFDSGCPVPGAEVYEMFEALAEPSLLALSRAG